MRGLLVITLIGLLLVVAIASGLCPCSLDPKGSESISVNASLHAEPLKTTTSTTTTTIPKPNLGPGHKSKTKLELVRNEVSLTHACSYYEISYPAGALGKFALIRDLATLKISKAKEVHGKLKDVTVEIKVREPYQVEVPIYGNCTGYVSLANLTNSTDKRCEDFNLTTYNETHCVYNYTCVVDYRKETRYRWVWKPLRWHDFRGMVKRAYQAPRKVKDLLDFNKIRDLLWDSFERERKVEIRVCGNYQPEFTDGAWRVAIDHVPFFKDREFWKFTWWNASWQYRKPITITEQSGNTLTDYQVAINITYDSEMQSDFDDLRFTWLNETSGDEQEIPYWIESKVDSDWAYVWIKVPEIPANGEATVYMYYGNSDATSESNGDNVFEFFDDFEGTSLDTSKWEVTSSSAGSYSVSNSKLYINLKTNTGSSKALTIRNKNAYPYSQIGSYIFEGYIKASGETYAETGWILSGFAVGKENSGGGGWDNKYCVGWEGYNDRYALHSWIGSMKSIELTASNDVWYIYYLHITSSSNAKGCIGDSCANSNWDIGSTTNYRWVLGGQGNAYVEYWIDWVRVRKFADPEPTITLGAEETLSPVVESVRTYNETYGNQTTFSIGDKVVIRANVTHPLGNQYVDSAVITIIDNASTVQVNNESMTLVSSFSGVYPDWSYRRPITITEQSGNTLTDYQVAINVTYDSDMQADFDDLRFTWLNETSGEEQEIPYWIEDKAIPYNLSVTAYYQTGTSCLSADDSGWNEFPTSGWNVREGDWYTDNWDGCDNCDYYAKIEMDLEYDTKPEVIMIEIKSDDGQWLWVNGQYVGHCGGGCHGDGICTKTWDITSYLSEGSNEIRIWCSDWEYGEYCEFKLLVEGEEIKQNGDYQQNLHYAYTWIKVPEIPASDSVTVYMYYGNPSATSESNGTAVFSIVEWPSGGGLGGSNGDIAVDADGNVIVVGNYKESGTYYNYVAKFDSDLNKLWDYKTAATKGYGATGVAVNSSGYIYVVGRYDTQGDIWEIYDPDGNQLYACRDGCICDIWTWEVEVDNEDYPIIAGHCGGDNYIIKTYKNGTKMAENVDGDGGYFDVAVLSDNTYVVVGDQYGQNSFKIGYHNNDLSDVWVKTNDYSGGKDVLYTVTVDSSNYIYASGEANNDWLITKWNTSGSMLWSKTYDMGDDSNRWDKALESIINNNQLIVVGWNGTYGFIVGINTETGDIEWKHWLGMNGATKTSFNGIAALDSHHYIITGYYENPDGSQRQFVMKWIIIDPEPSYSIGEEELPSKLTFEYNYTIPSDAVGGTWRAIVYANDTNGNWGSNETTFEVIADVEPPTITFVSQTPANLNESSTEPVTIIINITDPSGVNESRIAFFHGVNHTLGIAGTGFYHYNWSWRYPANDLQPDMRRADFRNMSYWFEEVVFKESPDDIWTFAGYDKTISEVFKIVDSGTNYTTVNITFFSAQMLFPQIFPFDKYYLTKENKTNQYVELYNNQWMKLKFYPKMFYNYTQENYTIYLDLNVDPSFTPNTRPLEIYFCNSSYTTGDPSKTNNCAYVEEIDSTDTRTIVIANSSYIQNVFYIADGYIDGVKVTDEAYLVLRTTAPPTQAFRLHYADDVINEYINFTNFGHAWVSSDKGNTWNPVSYTPDFYLISTQAERDKVMYYVYACDNLDNCGNSSLVYDSLDPVNHPPAEPLITEPVENATLTGLVNASWLTIGDPDFDPFNASIHLFYPDGTYFTTIAENIPGSNQQYNYTYEFNASLYPTGTYRLNVTLCDSHGLCSSSITPYNFTIYHVYEQPLEQGMTTSAYLRRILGKGQIVAVIVYDYLARTFMGYREILTVTSVTEALRIVLVRELEEIFTINIGFVEIPIKNLPLALTTTTELSTWFRQLRYLSDQLATSLTLAMEVVTLRVGEVSFSVSEAVARAVNMVRVSDLPVLISESLVKTIEVVREAEIAVTLAESLGKWIGVARIGEVAILVTDVMIRSINVAREMVAYLTSTVLLTMTRIETFLAQITVSDAVARVVIAVRPVVETISLILRFTLEYPAIPTFLLPAPPYALFAWATNIETLFVLLVAISVAIIVSTVYVFNKRHELFEHPTERFFGKKKKKR